MAGNVVVAVLERLKGGVRVREHEAIVNDHWHTDAVVIRLRDGSQAYVRYDWARGSCELRGVRIVFEDGEVHTLTGEEAKRFNERFWEVIE
jgi:hypothetical protein